MSVYVSDKSGVWWKKDIFTKFWLNEQGDTLYAWIHGDCDEVSAEFAPSSWDYPDFTDPVIVPSPLGYFRVTSWLDQSGNLRHRRWPVIAWLVRESTVEAVAHDSGPDRRPQALLNPNGEVFQDDKVWATFQDYLHARGAELKERRRSSPPYEGDEGLSH